MIRALVVLGLVAGAATAHAESRRIVGLLDVRGPSGDVTKAFQSSLEAQLDSKQYWLVPQASMQERMAGSTSWTDGCLVGPCVTEVRVQTGAELAILAALTGKDTSFGYVVTLLRTDTGAIVSQASERCDVCTLDEAINGAILATIQLLVTAPDKLPEPGHETREALAVATRDAGAKARAEQHAAEHRAHRRGMILTIAGVAVAAAGTAAYFLVGDRPAGALGAAGAGVGLAAGGLVLFAF